MGFLVIGDLYNRIFGSQSSNPELLVEYEIWTQINHMLPKDYVLPDPTILGALNPTPK